VLLDHVDGSVVAPGPVEVDVGNIGGNHLLAFEEKLA
jgi:hypothetical protein